MIPSGDFHALIIDRHPGFRSVIHAACACGWNDTVTNRDAAVNAWTDHMVDCGAIITQEPVSA